MTEYSFTDGDLDTQAEDAIEAMNEQAQMELAKKCFDCLSQVQKNRAWGMIMLGNREDAIEFLCRLDYVFYGKPVIVKCIDQTTASFMLDLIEKAFEPIERQIEETNASAFDLLTEWKRFRSLATWHDGGGRLKKAGRCLDELPPLAEQLDNICEDLGIGLDAEGFPVFMNIGHGIEYGQPYYRSNREHAKLKDLRAVLEWIEIRHK